MDWCNGNKLAYNTGVSPEGTCLVVRPDFRERFSMHHEAFAQLSCQKHLVPIFITRWHGSATKRPMNTDGIHHELLAALEAIQQRYDMEETVWRLRGGRQD